MFLLSTVLWIFPYYALQGICLPLFRGFFILVFATIFRICRIILFHLFGVFTTILWLFHNCTCHHFVEFPCFGVPLCFECFLIRCSTVFVFQCLVAVPQSCGFSMLGFSTIFCLLQVEIFHRFMLLFSTVSFIRHVEIFHSLGYLQVGLCHCHVDSPCCTLPLSCCFSWLVFASVSWLLHFELSHIFLASPGCVSPPFVDFPCFYFHCRFVSIIGLRHCLVAVPCFGVPLFRGFDVFGFAMFSVFDRLWLAT